MKLNGAVTLTPGRAIAWTFGLAPVLLFVLTWSSDLSLFQRLARSYALPVLAVELAIIFIAVGEGLTLRNPQWLPLALLGAFGVVAWGTAIVAPYPAVALPRTGTWTIHLFFALALVSLARRQMLDFHQLRIAIQTGFLLTFALLVIFVATTEQTAEERVSALPAVGNIRWFGYYAAAVTGLAAPGFLRGNRLAVLVATIAFTLAFWTGTRGAIAAAIAGFSVSAILFDEFRSPQIWGRFLLCGLAGSLLCWALAALVPIEGQGLGSIDRVDDAGRVEFWLATIDSIRARPLLGWGDGQTVRFSVPLWGVAYPQPHNIVLQVLHAWGAVGGVLCLGLASWATPLFLKARSINAAPFQLSALMIAAYSFIDGSLYHVHSVALFALCVAAAIAAGMEESTQGAPPPSA